MMIIVRILMLCVTSLTLKQDSIVLMSSLHLHLRSFNKNNKVAKEKLITLATISIEENLKLVQINEPKMATRNVQTF